MGGGRSSCNPSPFLAFVPAAKFFQWAENTYGDDLPALLTRTNKADNPS